MNSTQSSVMSEIHVEALQMYGCWPLASTHSSFVVHSTSSPPPSPVPVTVEVSPDEVEPVDPLPPAPPSRDTQTWLSTSHTASRSAQSASDEHCTSASLLVRKMHPAGETSRATAARN